MRSFGRTPTQHDWCPHRKRTSGDRHTGQDGVQARGEDTPTRPGERLVRGLPRRLRKATLLPAWSRTSRRGTVRPRGSAVQAPQGVTPRPPALTDKCKVSWCSARPARDSRVAADPSPRPPGTACRSRRGEPNPPPPWPPRPPLRCRLPSRVLRGPPGFSEHN